MKAGDEGKPYLAQERNWCVSDFGVPLGLQQPLLVIPS